MGRKTLDTKRSGREREAALTMHGMGVGRRRYCITLDLLVTRGKGDGPFTVILTMGTGRKGTSLKVQRTKLGDGEA